MKQSVTESKKEFIRGQFSSRNKDAPETDRASGADCSAVVRILRMQCAAPNGNVCTAKEYKGFAMQPKSEWHEKAIEYCFKTIYTYQ